MDYTNAFLQGNAGQKVEGVQKYAKAFNQAPVENAYGAGDAAADILGSTAQYAMTGASIDAAFGGTTLGLGTAIGATVGLGMGIYNAFSSNSEDEAQQEAAKAFNAEQENLRLQQNALAKKKNEMLISKYETTTQNENLTNYMQAVSSPPAYKTV